MGQQGVIEDIAPCKSNPPHTVKNGGHQPIACTDQNKEPGEENPERRKSTQVLFARPAMIRHSTENGGENGNDEHGNRVGVGPIATGNGFAQTVFRDSAVVSW